MRLVTFVATDGSERIGAQVGDRVVDLPATDPSLPATMRGLLAAGPAAMEAAAKAIKSQNAVGARVHKLRPPIPDPQKIICVGLNYKDHAAEQGAPLPKEPVIFNKFPSALIGPEDPILLPKASQEVDYEAELVVVLGSIGKHVPAARAMDYVAGYTVGHDVSARDWQIRKDGKQWLLGKSFDTFAPIGPALVTKDEVPDPHKLPIRFALNGKTMQQSNTEQLIFRVEKLIEYVTQVFTIAPGDLIFTGTPHGVGFARTPPVFLKDCDVCEVSIEGIGTLRNRCVQER